jgi:hypothetical protein
MYLVCIIWWKNNLFFTKGTLNPGIQEFCKFKVVRNADQTYPGILQIAIYPGKVIEYIITFPDKFVDFIHYNYYNLFFLINSFFKFFKYLISRPPGHWYFFSNMFCQCSQEPVLGIYNFTVNI